MIPLPFKQVDVFTDVPFKGNPLAVIFDADGLTDDQFLSIAKWTNLSETIFVLRPTDAKAADYKVKIYTPGGEVPFAGHPTVGVCQAFRERHELFEKTKFVQECELGLVEVEINVDNKIYFKLPHNSEIPIPDKSLQSVYTALGITNAQLIKNEPTLLNVGPKWLVIQLSNYEQVLALKPDNAKLASISAELGITGCCCFGEYDDSRFETRTFAPVIGIDEDPVCGSGAGAVAVHLSKKVQCTGAIALQQGAILSRNGQISVIIDADGYKVGGHSITVIDGTIQIAPLLDQTERE